MAESGVRRSWETLERMLARQLVDGGEPFGAGHLRLQLARARRTPRAPWRRPPACARPRSGAAPATTRPARAGVDLDDEIRGLQRGRCGAARCLDRPLSGRRGGAAPRRRSRRHGAARRAPPPCSTIPRGASASPPWRGRGSPAPRGAPPARRRSSSRRPPPGRPTRARTFSGSPIVHVCSGGVRYQLTSRNPPSAASERGPEAAEGRDRDHEQQEQEERAGRRHLVARVRQSPREERGADHRERESQRHAPARQRARRRSRCERAASGSASAWRPITWTSRPTPESLITVLTTEP